MAPPELHDSRPVTETPVETTTETAETPSADTDPRGLVMTGPPVPPEPPTGPPMTPAVGPTQPVQQPRRRMTTKRPIDE
eukprot:9467002-Pyramimonas_sp.AAC.1